MERVLVTGGAGFIGSHFVRHLLQGRSDVAVVNLDLLTYAGNLANVADLAGHPRHRFVQGDIADPAVVESSFAAGVDWVVNLAAESHVDRSIADPGVFVRTNVQGTQVLLDAARRHGVRKFLQVSTDEVYGSAGPAGAFTEATPLAPSSPYSASKAGADLLVLAYGHTYGLPVNVTRCCNNYGAYQYPEKLMPRAIIRALRDEPVPVYGDGQQVREWLHVADHCAALGVVLERGTPGQVYNIGGCEEEANLALVRRILALVGKPASLIEFVPDRPGHDQRYAIDASKIRRELGWRPQQVLETGLPETVAWYRQSEAWWRPLLERQGAPYW